MTSIHGDSSSRVDRTAQAQKIEQTKSEIKKVVNAIIQVIPQDKESLAKIDKIAQELYKFADENRGAVGKEGFTKLLKQITPENVIGVI